MRGVIICPDQDLTDRLHAALTEVGLITIARTFDHYPEAPEIVRFVRTHAPEVIFLGTDPVQKAAEVVRDIEHNTPGIQIVAFGRSPESHVLLELMRAGVREFATFPFERAALRDLLLRVRETLNIKPAMASNSANVFAFLPSKAGVGTSTLALNVSTAMAQNPANNVLLSDFDLSSGMMRFMLKLENKNSIIDASEHSHHMDENLWPQMVTKVHKLDVLHAGQLNPDFRIEAAQIRHLMEHMRRAYNVLCFDLSGNMERYSLEIMHESKRIFLVCTPEIPSLHLAREKYMYLKQLDLHDRVSLLLNRMPKRPLITPAQIEELLGLKVEMTFPNDYFGVQRAMTMGRTVETTTELGKQFVALAHYIMGDQKVEQQPDHKKRFIEFFSVIPGKSTAIEKKTAV